MECGLSVMLDLCFINYVHTVLICRVTSSGECSPLHCMGGSPSPSASVFSLPSVVVIKLLYRIHLL